MKKLLLLLLMFVSVVASAQENKKCHRLDLNNIPRTEFPCAIYSSSVYYEYQYVPSEFFSTPVDLSVYCSAKAQKNITQAKNLAISGIVLGAVGGIMLGIDADVDLLGIISIAAGTICETVGVVDLISHFQWEYRRKQVDLYLMPTGATLKF